jgi:hypothetical protein
MYSTAARGCNRYFSSSFGAYINLIYLATRPHAGQKSFSVRGGEHAKAVWGSHDAEQHALLAAQGYVVIEDYASP